MIDKVYIFTILPRGRDRANMCLGGLLSNWTPVDRIEMFAGPDHEDYADRKEICEAAAADGFPAFLKWTKDSAHSVLAQNWGYCQLFRKIQQNNETAMWLHDDCMLKFQFHRYESLADV